jgi:toxin YoeB
MKYRAIIKKSGEWWIGWLIDLPGVNAQERTRKKLIDLIKDCMRDPFRGLGKPEPLKGQLVGFWPRRINNEHRLVYKYEGDELFIIACRFHYEYKLRTSNIEL